LDNKQYDKLKSEASRELTEKLTEDIEQDNNANAKEYGNVNNDQTYDNYLNQLSEKNQNETRKQKSEQSQENNFLNEEMKAFGLNSEVEQDGDRGSTDLLQNQKSNKTTK